MTTFPFTAIVGQGELKLALELAVVDRSIGGVLAFGDRGTGKSTAIRALARLLPPMRVTDGCPYHCDPATECETCDENGRVRNAVEVPVPVVDLPLGATEDRVVGALDLEAALTRGERRFSPGLLASAHRGFLYIDEVNLLPESPGRPAARRCCLGPERGRARGRECASPRPLRTHRQRQPGGGRASPTAARPLWPFA